MKIKVPGSSANLGPGFDCFGIAWQCYNQIEFLSEGSGLEISGCDIRFQNRDNLAYAGYRAALEYCALPESPLKISFSSTEIPVSRGLGSSAALIVGGVIAADALNGLGLSQAELLNIASAVEGHPDNVAPALLGGFTVSAMDGAKAVKARFELSDKLHFTALIPDFELSTRLARGVLPSQVPREDAIYNVSRSALLLKALELGDGELLSFALSDRLHQPFRTRLIAGYDRAMQLSLALGAAGMCISGAGSTLLCVAESQDFAVKMAKAMGEEFPAWRVLPLLPDRTGAAIL